MARQMPNKLTVSERRTQDQAKKVLFPPQVAQSSVGLSRPEASFSGLGGIPLVSGSQLAHHPWAPRASGGKVGLGFDS